MSLGDLYVRGQDGCFELVTSKRLTNPENNVFDEAFNADMDMEEWNEWIHWKGGITKPDSCVLGQKESSSSTVMAMTWSTDFESASEDVISASKSAGNESSLEVPLFEYDETPLLSHSQQLTPDTSSFLTIFQASQNYRTPPLGYISLTKAEEQRLQNITMPYRMVSEATICSEPSSSTGSHLSLSPSPSPSRPPSLKHETRTHKDKKRKSIVDSDGLPNALCHSQKRRHNAVEKIYRTNLNDKLNCLREGVPSLSRNPSSESKSGEEGEVSVDSKTGEEKCGKAAVMIQALEYIEYLESTVERFGSEVAGLKMRVRAFEKLAMVGASNRLSLVRNETLESIQADFKQIRLRSKSVSGPITQRRGSKQSKVYRVR